jgi:hypothetical protein
VTDTKASLSRVSAAQWPLGTGERYWDLSHFRVRHKHLAEQPYAEHENSPWTSPRLPKSVKVVTQIVQQTIHSRAEDPPRTFRRLSLWAHTAPGLPEAAKLRASITWHPMQRSLIGVCAAASAGAAADTLALQPQEVDAVTTDPIKPPP